MLSLPKGALIDVNDYFSGLQAFNILRGGILALEQIFVQIMLRVERTDPLIDYPLFLSEKLRHLLLGARNPTVFPETLLDFLERDQRSSRLHEFFDESQCLGCELRKLLTTFWLDNAKELSARHLSKK